MAFRLMRASFGTVVRLDEALNIQNVAVTGSTGSLLDELDGQRSLLEVAIDEDQPKVRQLIADVQASKEKHGAGDENNRACSASRRSRRPSSSGSR